MELQELLNILKENNLEIKKKWGVDGSQDNISIFGRGRYYESILKGIKMTCSKVTVDGREEGVRIKFFFSSPLNLGLYCSWNTIFLTVKPEGRDIFAKKVETGIEGLKCWAIKKDVVEKMFHSNQIITPIKLLLDTIKSGKGSKIDKLINLANYFIIDDKSIVIFILSNFSLDVRSFLDTVSKIIVAIEDYFKLEPKEVFKENLSQKILKIIIFLLIILSIVIFGWVIFSNLNNV